MTTPIARALETARLRTTLPAAAERRAIRERAGIPQTAIAAELRVDRGAVSRWESGARQPRGENLRRYARVLRRLADIGSDAHA